MEETRRTANTPEVKRLQEEFEALAVNLVPKRTRESDKEHIARLASYMKDLKTAKNTGSRTLNPREQAALSNINR
ncbi:MAG: hypothetical protein ABW189_01445 [Rickettsiales bacterium]